MKKVLFALTLMGAGAGIGVADTLILQDGTRIEGTYLGGTARQITFMQADRGTRRTFDVGQVHEVMFGTNTSPVSSQNPWGNTQSPGAQTGNYSSYDNGNLVRRLYDAVLNVMNTTQLSQTQRETLTQATNVLRNAMDNRQSDEIMMRDIRRALEDIRYVANGANLRQQDRQFILNTIDELRSNNRNQRNRNGGGVFNDR